MTRRSWVLGAALLSLAAGGVGAGAAIAGARGPKPADCCDDPACPATDCCLDPTCPPGCSPVCPPNCCDGDQAKAAPASAAKGCDGKNCCEPKATTSCPPCPFCW